MSHSDTSVIGGFVSWMLTLKVNIPKKAMCPTLMKGVTHDGSFLWIFGPDTMAIGRFYWMLHSYVPNSNERRYARWVVSLDFRTRY